MLNKLRIKNFRSINYLDLSFKTDEKIVLVKGGNGVGKSTILESIFFALYGESRNGRSKLDSLIKNSERELEITLDFNINDQNVEVTRVREKGKSYARVYRNGILVSDSVEGVNAYLRLLLGVSSSSFKKYIYSPQKELDSFFSKTPSERKSILSEALKLDVMLIAKEQFIQEIKENDRAINELNSLLTSRYKNSNAEELFIKKDIAQGTITSIKEDLVNIKNSLDELSPNFKIQQERKVSIKYLQGEIVNLKLMLANAPKFKDVPFVELKDFYIKKSDLLERISKAKNDIEVHNNNLINYQRYKTKQSRINEIKIQINALKTGLINEPKIANNDIDNKISTLNNRLIDINLWLAKEESNLKSFGNGICSICKKDLEDSSKHISEKMSLNERIVLKKFIRNQLLLEKIAYEKDQKLFEIEKLNSQKIVSNNNDIESKVSKLEIELTLLKVDYVKIAKPLMGSSLFGNLTLLENELENINTDIEEIEANNKLFQNNLNLAQNNKTISLNLSRTEKELSGVLSEYNEKIEINFNELTALYEKKIQDLAAIESQIFILKSELNLIENEINQNNIVLDKINILKEKNSLILKSKIVLLKAVDSISKSLTPFITSNIAKNLASISNGAFTAVTLDCNHSISLKKGGSWIDYENLSGGEQDLTSLLFRLAMIDYVSYLGVSANLPILFLDEVFSSLDQSRRQSVFNLLTASKNKFNQIFVVSHIQEFDDIADKLIALN